eukprot:TRINITY_DN7849_c0_g1_i1.p1 TRINITY_DN7849_c0_g1~~TRINITY_DN7849_c0_g1_i1.p1  ORF type:complete len:314 (+),score=54.95 TRINITY_DN7849_c0_g1_i1:62-943(+)
MGFVETCGLLAIAYVLLRLGLLIKDILGAGNLARYHTKGTYALVTGSTDGIGKALVFEFARRGFNVIIHGRNPDKVQDVLSEARKRYPAIKFETWIVNATEGDVEKYVAKIKHLPISVVINNVGVGVFGGKWLHMEDATQEQVNTMICTNVRFTTLVTRAFLPVLPRSSLIVIVGSHVSQFAPATLIIYGSTKSYLAALVGGLRREVRAANKPGINVQYLQVGSVATPGSPNAVSLTSPTPEAFATSMLDRIGGSQEMVVGYPWHWMTYLATSLPSWFLEPLFKIVMKNMKKE